MVPPLPPVSRVSLVSVGLVLVLVLPARAQDRQWELVLQGGFATGTTPDGGTGRLPPGAGTIIPFPGLSPQPSISSWYFGEGAALFNQVMNWIGRSASIVPLDPVLTSSAVARQPGAQFGARIGRVLSSRLTAEFGFDVDTSRLAIAEHATNIAESTRFTSTDAFNWIDIGNDETVTHSASKGGYQLITTGSLRISVGGDGATRPFVTLGGGARSSVGTAELTLDGGYSFAFNQLFFEERDTVRVRFESRTTPVLVVGGGFTRALSPTSGLRTEVRLLAGPNGTRTRLDATPTRADHLPNGTLIISTFPALSFATPGSVGESTLSGPAIADFETFSGSGTSVVFAVTFGYVRRF